MDPARFDRLSKCLTGWRLSRRRAVQGLAAAGVAGALAALGSEPAAADCADIAICAFACEGAFSPIGLHDVCTFKIPGGPHGACWSWDTFRCSPCSTPWDTLHALCANDPLCRGRGCTAHPGAP